MFLPATDSLRASSAITFVLNNVSKTTSGRTVRPDPSGFNITFDATSQTFVVTNEEASTTMGPGELDTGTPSTIYPSIVYKKPIAGDSLVIFKRANATPAINVSYAAYGAWQHNDTLTQTPRVRLDYFVYGSPTPQAAIPTTGQTTYRWAGTGNAASDPSLVFLEESGTLTIDWAAKTFTTIIQTSVSDFFTGSFGGGARLSVTGVVVVDRLDGTATFVSGLPGSQATFKGRVFGPNVDDVGFLFTGTDANSVLVGAAVGTSR